jgi:hypothetical protein
MSNFLQFNILILNVTKLYSFLAINLSNVKISQLDSSLQIIEHLI